MKSLAFWLGLFLFSIYLLTFSGKLHVMDEFVGYAVGNNLVQHGRADVNQYIWTNHWHSTPPGLWGTDNNLYTKKAPGISLAAMPLIWLGHTLPGLSAVHMGLLLSSIVTALTGSLLLIWLTDVGLSRFVATLTALMYGLCTIALVYARLLWEHSVMALLFLVMFWALYRAIYTPETRRRLGWVLLCSLAAAISLTMRFEALAVAGLVGAFFFLYAIPLPKPFLNLFKQKIRWLWAVVYAALPALTIIGLLWFNQDRFGAISETGYNREIAFGQPWVGAFGLLFSPSTGMFIYMPVLLLLFFGLKPGYKRLPQPYFWLIWAVTIFYWIFYGSWFSWGSTWVWGPRFLLHTLPLLMLFVAEALARLPAIGSTSLRRLAWLGAALLALVGLVINSLGVLVDLNEHFLRLNRNDNYLFNWEAFAPLGHWRILLEGLTDTAWLRPSATGPEVYWSTLTPMLLLLLLTALAFVLIWLEKERWGDTPQAPRPAARVLAHPFTIIAALILTAALVYLSLRAAARVELAGRQAQFDAPLLDILAAQSQPGDLLLVAMPPFGDVQELTTTLMAYTHQSLPTYAWIESEPRAIQPDEQERLWQAANAGGRRAWLFERWLTPTDPLGQTAARFNREAFPVQENWFEQSGRLTLYALPTYEPVVQIVPLNIPFEGGLTLVSFEVLDSIVAPGEVAQVRLTWQAVAAEQAPPGGLVGFVHLRGDGSNIAQYDRLLLDIQQPKQSPLLPGQTVSQGYGLRLPADTPPGSYPLIAGVYASANGQRLPRADDSPDDFIYLTNITVTENE